MAKKQNAWKEHIFSGGTEPNVFKWVIGDQERNSLIYRREDEFRGHTGMILCSCYVAEYDCIFTGEVAHGKSRQNPQSELP